MSHHNEQREIGRRRSLPRRLLVISGLAALIGAGCVIGNSSRARVAAAGETAIGVWSDSTVPSVPDDPDTNAATVGTQFTTSVDGEVTGLQFYRSAENLGPHTGQLWSAQGALLASVDFPDTDAVGWLTASLSTPVAVSSGSTFTASYTAPAGHYADDQNALSPSEPSSNGPLTAINGVYTYDGGAPTSTWNDSNYYVDVVFSPSSDGPAPTTTTRAAPPTTARTTTTTAPSAPDVTDIWPDNLVLNGSLDADISSVTLGTEFVTSSDGWVSGIQFYRTPAALGTHVGQLWSDDGRLLAQVTFPDSTTTGWATAQFPTPVAVVQGRTYTIVYTAPNGGYVAEQFALSPSQPVSSGPLTAIQGVYSYDGGAPTTSWNDSNYYVDVLFSAGSTGGTTPTTTQPTTQPTTTQPATTAPATTTRPTTTPATTAPPTTPVTTSPSTVVPGLGCAVLPSRCGYPDATNTGVKPGVGLRTVPDDLSSGPGWSFDSRGWVEVDGNGADLENLYIPYPIDITASNVTIRNVQIEVGDDSIGIGMRHTNNITIEDSTIGWSGSADRRMLVDIKDIYGDASNTQVLRNNIFGGTTGVQIYAGTIADNYIHGLLMRSGDHINGTTSNGFSTPLTINHNTVFNSYGQTDAISLFEDFGVEANRTISNNLLAGGGYTIYGGANPGGQQTSNIHITGNRIARIYYPNGGYYGPATAYDPNGPGNTWTNNIWDETGATIPRP